MYYYIILSGNREVIKKILVKNVAFIVGIIVDKEEELPIDVLNQLFSIILPGEITLIT